MKRTGSALLATVLTVGGLIAVAGPATAAGCDSEVQTRGDLDGDGTTDVVVGMPSQNDQAGVIDVRYTGRPSQVITAGQLGGFGGEGTYFGSAVAVGDLDGDGCGDLVVGALREGDTGSGYPGAVHIVFGSPDGLVIGSAITLPYTKSTGTSFDDFGSALALTKRAGTDDVHDLYVGAPGRTVGGHASAGGVVHYTITPSGTASRVTVGSPSVATQDSPGVPGAAEANDRFGEELTADFYRAGVFAGASLEDVGSAKDAGAIWWLGLAADGAWGTSATYSQNTAKVPGTAEAGDHFGAALSIRGAYLAVGVPDENDGSKKDSGMVQLFRQTTAGTLSPFKTAFTQDSPGVPGAVEAGDRFGAAVAMGSAIFCQESVDVAVGAPGEDVGSKADAGTVTLYSLVNVCPAKALRQGSGLNGATEAGDAVGGVLTISRGRTDLDEDYSDRLLVGVPLEDIGAVTDAGMVESTNPSIRVNGASLTNLQFSGGFINTRRYGQVLASSSD
ncbi:FG-GAP-like repeat-containing protein [Spongisporangium articulatum]|uniref:FG-GAP-like repeat-containing protein n=1 Tax=Spongisporangium articulatum TaxID=3362603 RepID=A0ABW8AMV6_9ACTN